MLKGFIKFHSWFYLYFTVNDLEQTVEVMRSGACCVTWSWDCNDNQSRRRRLQDRKYKLLCPRGTQTCALAVANIAHAVYLLDVAKRPIPQG